MPGLDALPADQRTVLQLVLRQGRSYDAIARALRLDPPPCASARTRGWPASSPPRASPIRDRGRVADWLLGQHEDGAAALVAQDGPARRWASALRDELAPVAAAALPDLPDAAAADGRRDRPAARRGAGPARPRPPPARRPASRRGGVVLLAALALLTAVVVVVVLVLRGDDDSSTGTQAATSSTPRRPRPRRRARPPRHRQRPRPGPGQPHGAEGRPGAQGARRRAGRHHPGQAGDQRDRPGPPDAHEAGAATASGSIGNGGRKWLGYFRNADQQGRLVAQGQLDQRLDITTYKRPAHHAGDRRAAPVAGARPTSPARSTPARRRARAAVSGSSGSSGTGSSGTG